MDTIRVLRVLEYVGPRDLVEAHLRQVIHGEKTFGPQDLITIRAATIGTFPEILGTAEPAKKANYLCSVCLAEQFETSAGISCLNGHGGAPSA